MRKHDRRLVEAGDFTETGTALWQKLRPVFSKSQQYWGNNNDQTYSCPRDWRLSAIMGVQLSKTPKTPRTITTLSY